MLGCQRLQGLGGRVCHGSAEPEEKLRICRLLPPEVETLDQQFDHQDHLMRVVPEPHQNVVMRCQDINYVGQALPEVFLQLVLGDHLKEGDPLAPHGLDLVHCARLIIIIDEYC